jgi:hypothetical protein
MQPKTNNDSLALSPQETDSENSISDAKLIKGELSDKPNAKTQHSSEQSKDWFGFSDLCI